MIIHKLFLLLALVFISSCSNLLTWHLDKGIHAKNNGQKVTLTTNDSEKKIYQSSIKAQIIWDTSVNSGIYGNSSYLYPAVEKDIIYTVDTEGLLSAVSLEYGNVLWNLDTDVDITSGLSVVNNKICVGTTSAQLLCYDLDKLSTNKHIPLISNVSNLISFSDYEADIDIDLLTELSSPVQSVNNYFLVKLDNDDLYLIDPQLDTVIWKSTSQIISLRSKGSSMPLVDGDQVYIARDNGSISSYNVSDGVLNWFTIISSRSGRNDLESQRDAEMSINVNNGRLYYGHFQGELNSLDLATGQIIWSSPFSFINDIIIDNNSIYGSTTDNILVSIDLASGFLNWKSPKSDEKLTKPFIIDDIVMAFTTEGTLVGFKKDGTLIYESKFDFELHPQTQFIVKKNKLYFQTLDGDIVHILITV
tara:strand:- start:2912 stop:4165 length:1254 start_codon:yes stop_codon:yes gene_type:complete